MSSAAAPSSSSASRVWFVTGSSRGLGRAIVRRALESGDRVIATARQPSQLDEFVQKYGDKVLPVALDVTDPAAAEAAVQAGHKKFGRIDVVVNNAGYGDLSSLEDTTLDSFHKQVNTNFFGVVYVTKAVLPILREQKSGHIFQISSIGGRVATPGLSAYQSAKWAIGGFSLSVAQEVAPFGIQITVMEPGGIRTDWAGASMTIPPISQPYEQSVGNFKKAIDQIAGNEVTSPAKMAELIEKLVGRKDAPARLLVGTDAVQYGSMTAAALAESDAKWKTESLSCGF